MRRLFVPLILFLAPLSASAQTPPPAPPQIAVMGRGEVTIAPDEATVVLSMETRAATAAAAGAQNAQRMRAVREALRRIGFPADSIMTVGYTVSPTLEYPSGRERLTGYVAMNTIRVRTRRVDQVGEIIDTALGAGANRVSYVQFGSTRMAQARRAALAQAIAEARADAEAMAQAGGGALGPLLELSTANLNPRGDAVALQAVNVRGATAAETPITPSEIAVQVVVTAKWSFVSR
jgi:uncharacterized protein YggE